MIDYEKIKFSDITTLKNGLKVYTKAKALRFAAGYISCFDEHKNKHPEEVYQWLLKQGGADD